MDRKSIYRGQVPYETDLLSAERLAYEGFGLSMADIIGTATVVARLAATPTSPASLAFKVGPGSIYKYSTLDTDWGKVLGTGGLDGDATADHQIMKQGLLRDTQTFAVTPPVTSGQSVIYLLQAQFQEADDAAVTTQFYNTANPNAPISSDVSPFRRDICALGLKAGTPATTGSQVCPAADAGWVPVWAVTVAFGATAINAGNIAAAPGAPFLAIAGGGGGGGSTPTNWQTVAANYTAAPGDKLILDTSGAAFTVKLTAAPVADSTTLKVKGNCGTVNVTIDGNGHSFDLGALGLSATFVLNKDGINDEYVFDGTHWRP